MGLLVGQVLEHSMGKAPFNLCLLFLLQGGTQLKVGDLIEISRFGYEHWAIYVGKGYVVHLAPPSKHGFSVKLQG